MSKMSCVIGGVWVILGDLYKAWKWIPAGTDGNYEMQF